MPDYRSEKMESLEGEGIAQGRWRSYQDRTPDEIFQLADDGREYYEELPDEAQFCEVASAIEQAELVGFWLAWHSAGGFTGLEQSGWNRSTIFRKVRRFRAVYGDHPDNHRFAWLRVDWDRAWGELLGRLVDLGQRRNHHQGHDDEPLGLDDAAFLADGG
jgi:hypothetical protein